MSGTSLDGVDYVLCKENPKTQKIEFVAQHFVAFKKSLYSSLLKATRNELSIWEAGQLHYDLGRFYAEGLKKIQKNKNWKLDLIGLHGQTVFHEPQKCSLQIGEPSFLKKEFQVPVVSQFRNMDIVLKGQGAPLAPFFHKALMQGRQKWAFQNLGGMGNVSFVKQKKLYAFDTGPGNILINEFMQKLFRKDFDKNGDTARKGIPNLALIESWLKDVKYFSKPIPKSCGRENMSMKGLGRTLQALNKLSPEDQIATLTEFTVLSLKDQYCRFIKPLPELIVVSGGGAKNQRLMQRMAFHFHQSQVVTSEQLLGWPVDAIEGGAFAWLALKRYREEIIADLSTVTGAQKNAVLGMLC